MAEPKIIVGKDVAEKVYDQVARDLVELGAKGLKPGLAVVLVGDNPASQSYVRAKDRMSLKLGLHSEKIELSKDSTQEEVMAVVERLNNDPAIHGILVQSPPPKHIDEAAIVAAINPAKDVDGFHNINLGKLVHGDPSGFVPCTPLGCQRLLVESGIDPEGTHVVIVGRSMLVG
jgi:methylenetetrahydrofolate dehydrogenase (NADP+)/methenyltetrahydrofolate cyclohydrolase